MLVSGELEGQVLQQIHCAVGGDLGWATWVAVKCGPAAELQQGASAFVWTETAESGAARGQQDGLRCLLGQRRRGYSMVSLQPS